ncbi:carboxypeptidase regulatory-like domain-containing protein [Arachidicoccus ginsenosidivorans]|uniref:Carboxypeptidase regulatory-like domain-containing protein n=1 Tax=Arachidicoccus ginsenosidivorans TaxID=496057 RepID=A0A5B8VVC1_9BACT|nr:carboxypeptidase regulatory-like domain-containing protein [Arachidicoccus ginsenosidivorans]QEC74128.1 carboxypeptidase regulatory-like domain-containing protein [Arachidicoccus ginsenosidivorans]
MCYQTAKAQDKIIVTGKVTDANGAPLSGVSVTKWTMINVSYRELLLIYRVILPYP